MKLWSLFAIFLVTLTCEAELAPRMYSIMGQLSLTGYQGEYGSGEAKTFGKSDLNLIYFAREGLSFGVQYLSEASNQTGTTETGSTFGLTLGYYWEKGFYILGHYQDLAILGDWEQGRGQQFDLGYLSHIGGQFHIGVQLTDRTILYKKNTATLATGQSRTYSETYPNLVFMYLY
jgi:hypothetical protein